VSLTLDKKYIDMLSPKLPLFKWESSKMATCRCPICGDSKKKKLKKRGNFYQKDSETFIFKCFNCSVVLSTQSLLKALDTDLYDKYMYEKFQYNNRYKWYSHNQQKQTQKLEKYYKGTHALKNLKSIEELEDSHFAKLYCIKRKIPVEYFKVLYYTDNYVKWIKDNVSPDKFKYVPEKDERIVIPFFTKGKLPFAFQGRYIGEDRIEDSLRYITINESQYPLIYGLDRVNMDQPINVVEGPIDSLFVKNCLAAAGSALKKVKTGRKIFDNQPRNKEVIALLKETIDAGFPVVIWEDHIQAKDINDLVKDLGWSLEQVDSYLNSRTFVGLKAKLEFEKWKKI